MPAATSAPTAPRDQLRWLAGHPDLDALRATFPDQWRRVLGQLDRATHEGPDGVRAALADVTAARPTSDRRAPLVDVVAAEARRQLLLRALEAALFSAETGVAEGRVRMGLLQGAVAQRLLFRRGLERRPVHLVLFRLVWPLLSQRRRIMPLVRKRGIYCFYSGALVRALDDLIDGRRALEIAAGDGTLTGFLQELGADVVATDDHSWQGTIDYPDHVRRLDAVTALRAYRPEVVLCSWPPAGNTFEQAVFRSPSVQTYIVIGGSSQGTGNWETYAGQSSFDMQQDDTLADLVLPPEHAGVVLVFRRRSATADVVGDGPGGRGLTKPGG